MLRVITILILFFFLQSCYGVRTIYPKVNGYVYDRETVTPVTNCKVNGIETDENGYFQLEEQRRRVNYRRQRYWMDVELIIQHEGFVSDTIIKKAGYGGYPKGVCFELDTIYLEHLRIELQEQY